MATPAQDLIDRRKLRRKLTFWRVAAALILTLALLGLPFALGLVGPGSTPAGDQIARISIEGMIFEDQKLIDLMGELKEDDSVKAVILRIDSPGGTTLGGETLFNAAREIAAVKPVAAEVGTLAASAGYMIATAADFIVARQTSIVGSIGVIFQYVDASDLLETVGVDVNEIKSAPLKAEPSPFHPAPEAAKEMISRLVMDTYEWFVALVDERRPMDAAAVRRLADGSIFSGRQGLENQLIDALGGEPEVRRWLEGQRGVPAGLEIVDREPPRDDLGFSLLGGARALIFDFVGVDPRAGSVLEAVRGSSRLDGLLSLWQPSHSGASGR